VLVPANPPQLTTEPCGGTKSEIGFSALLVVENTKTVLPRAPSVKPNIAAQKINEIASEEWNLSYVIQVDMEEPDEGEVRVIEKNTSRESH
jgi:hypothetical protein